MTPLKIPTQSLSVNEAEVPQVSGSKKPAESMARKAGGRSAALNSIGARHDFITIIGVCEPNGKQTRVMIRCDCGVEKSIRFEHFGSSISSCGCKRVESQREKVTKHGHHIGNKTSKTKQAYNSMLNRCYRASDPSYYKYAPRGITVCDRWRFGDGEKTGFECFLADLGEPPSPKHSLDRIDNDAGYSPQNCRWATWAEQANNRRVNVFVEWNGQRKTVTQWAREMGMSDTCLSRRLKSWTLEEAMTRPVRPRTSIKP